MAADCGPDIKTIEKCMVGGNAPGLRTAFHVAEIAQVDSIPSPTVDTLKVETDIVMRVADAVGPPIVTAGLFKSMAISKVNGSWKVEPVGEGENISYKVTVTVFINKIDADKSYSLNNTTGREFIVITEDRNAKKRIVGNTSEGCSIKVGEQTNDANGYPVIIEWDTPILPYFYTGNIVT